MSSNVELHEMGSRNLPGAVPYAVLTPAGYGESGVLPLCLMLMGGGGSRQNLVDCRPLFEGWWADGSIPPMVLATPSPGMDYYVEDAERGVRWESFLTEEFVPHLRATCNVDGDRLSTAITGISVGGYGALKTAFGRPEAFAVAAAMQPMIEPGFRDAEIGPRNRLHHASGGPERLVGPHRDAGFFEANNPANRARANAVRIRETGLAIYLEAGDEDLLNAHDGTEFLHQVLWDLDLSHEYRMVRRADHGGPSLRPRMRAMFAWVGSVLAELQAEAGEPAAEDRAVSAWIEGGMEGAPPAAGPSSKEFLRIMRARMRGARERAAELDATTGRRFGVLGKGGPPE